jgi:mannose-1-phosphate guanylyltransferase
LHRFDPMLSRKSASRGEFWSIVLAAGAGNRLASLTTDPVHGHIPKQYCSLEGGPSLLESALLRAWRVAGAARTVVVVAEGHAKWWCPIQSRWDGVRFVPQPLDRGTAAGLLLPLEEIRARDPGATVAVLAADHYVEDEVLLATSLRKALLHARRSGRIVLLGLEPDEEDGELGWILPSRSDRPRSRVAQFREKPGREVASLIDRGALINGFLMAGNLSAWLEILRERVPDVVAAFHAAGGHYSQIPRRDLSREVFEPAAGSLLVQRVPACGWSDLGVPSRVEKVLRGRTAPAGATTGGVPILARRFEAQRGAALAELPAGLDSDIAYRNFVELL